MDSIVARARQHAWSPIWVGEPSVKPGLRSISSAYMPLADTFSCLSPLFPAHSSPTHSTASVRLSPSSYGKSPHLSSKLRPGLCSPSSPALPLVPACPHLSNGPLLAEKSFQCWVPSIFFISFSLINICSNCEGLELRSWSTVSETMLKLVNLLLNYLECCANW